MKKRSILFTVNITFIVTFILISAGFILLYNMHQKREDFLLHKRSVEIAKMFLDEYSEHGVTEKLTHDLERVNFTLLLDQNAIKKRLDDQNIKQRKLRHFKHAELYALDLDGKSSIYIESQNFQAILQDNAPVLKETSMSIVIYLAILLIFLFFYLSIINKLKPLKKLNKIVANFGDEEFDFEFLTRDEDEISKLMNEFSASAKKLKSIKESRNIFIRNVMHELKTPITKGKFLIHLPQSDANIDAMQKVFYRLEALINEFAAIEELIAAKKELQKQEYSLEDLVDNAADILMCDEEEVMKAFENIKLHVDFDLFSIALKNLLDNGIKYSSDKRVIVKSDNGVIIVENLSAPLAYPLENYFEPFFRGDDVKSNQSFGLGLYIVKHILDAHHMHLIYEHKDGTNRFMVVP
ncbi:MAG: ArsS family sensor histidine kinase [Sulfurimonas sp.]|nr:ArsS family sensor histidine kinase [Sulfurimonas sp.]